MTVREMNDLFNTLYDNADQEAPGLNSFEISQYLTKALFSIIKTRVDKYISEGASTGFQKDEANRYSLAGLIKATHIPLPIGTTVDIDRTVPNSEFFELPSDLYQILYEDCKVTSTKNPGVTGTCLIQPEEYSSIQKIMRNPFRKPNVVKERGYRLNKSLPNGMQLSEIVVEDVYKPSDYRLRYIKAPEPIVVEDLNSAYPGMGLSIHGATAPYIDPTGSNEATNVSPYLHELIVQRATELAIRHYRENTLQNNVQTENIL